MAQGVRADPEPRAALRHVLPHQAVDAPGRQPFSQIVQEQRRARAPRPGGRAAAQDVPRVQRSGTCGSRRRGRCGRRRRDCLPVLQPGPQRRFRRAIEGHQPLLAALAHARGRCGLPGSRLRRRARPARSGAAPRHRTAPGWRGRDGRADGTCPASRAAVAISASPRWAGQMVVLPRRADQRRRVAADLPFMAEMLAEGAHGRELSRRRRIGSCRACAGRRGTRGCASGRNRPASDPPGACRAAPARNVRNCERSLS